MTGEDRLRRLLRDPGWALPAWPDAQARVQRAARRQRRRLAAISAGAVAIAAATVVALALPGASPARVATGSSRPGVQVTTPTTSPRPSLSVPPVGSAGFPATIYPAATKPRVIAGVLSLCPDPAGLEAPGPATPAAATFVLRRLGPGLMNDLRLSDRSAWPLLTSNWRPGGIRLFPPSVSASIRYSGPLRPSPPSYAGLLHAVVTGCGSRVAASTWIVVYGPAHQPALDSVILFLTRRGHMLFYNAV